MQVIRSFATLFQLLLYFLLSGQELPGGLGVVASRQWIKDNFYTGKHQSLSYDSARIYMFGFIDNRDDSIECVYSGYRKYLAQGTNNVTFPGPVNTEHTVPQSFFSAQLPMVSDLFHLFPVFEDWNNDRGNNPFSDIQDNQTQKWILKDASQTSIPSSNIDLFSEYRSNTFEPREQHKGDLARAVFYFFTMYTLPGKNINDIAALSTLCLWAKNDPPDATEIARNGHIQQYQGNRNPFIDRPEWLMQAWGCTDILLSVVNMEKAEPVSVFPNPAKSRIVIEITQGFSGGMMNIYNLSGILLDQRFVQHTGPYDMSIENLPDGILILSVTSKDGNALGAATIIKN